MMSENAFKKGVPSLFVLTSPLQVLCALEAIKKYEIQEYKVILVLPENDRRNFQVINLCKKYGLKYTIVPPIEKWAWLRIFKKNHYYFKRAFIGDIRQFSQQFYAMTNMDKGGSVVCLDDGNDTIFLLKGENPYKWNIRAWLLLLLCNIAKNWWNVSLGHDLFTLYGDIENGEYHCELNDFSNLTRNISLSRKKRDGIYFIGTNYARFCSSENYPLELVKAGLYSFLSELRVKYPKDHIVYIPHGRDTTTFPAKICTDLNIDVLRPKTTIEMTLLEEQVIPSIVYGFTSTALYNIKKLFPYINVYNLTFEFNRSNQFIKQIRVVSDYYTMHGIQEVVLKGYQTT